MMNWGQGRLKSSQGNNVRQGKDDCKGNVLQEKMLVVIHREMLEQ
jgi:hypothetical protein